MGIMEEGVAVGHLTMPFGTLDDESYHVEWQVSQTFSGDDSERLLSVLGCPARRSYSSGLDMS